MRPRDDPAVARLHTGQPVGQVRLILADHDVTLRPGEAAGCATRLPHRFGPAGDQAAEVLSLPGRQGERSHVRAAPRRTADGG